MNKILLIVDMQNDFIDGSLGTKEAIAVVPRALEKIRDFDGDVFYTKDTHSQDYMSTSEGRALPVQHCVKCTEGWRLHPDIEKLCIDKKATGVEKVTFGAADLPDLLKKRYPDGVDEIEIIGLCTDICVISNALLLKAFFPETKITVDAACCAGVTPQSHQNALDAMRSCQVEIVNA